MARGSRVDTLTATLIASTAVLWVTGGLLAFGLLGHSGSEAGVFLALLAALKTALLIVRSWLLKLEVATVHGYHAGYHRAMQTRCTEGLRSCDVLDMAEVRARRLSHTF